MSNYPDGLDTPESSWNPREDETQRASCEICDRLCISDDEGSSWKDASSGKYLDGDKTPDGRFVCSKACSSQAMYDAATEEERAALNLLARWNESTLILKRAFLSFNPYQRDLDVKHGSVWEQWHSGYDILKLYKLVEQIGYALAGDDEAPAWYTEAVGSVDDSAVSAAAAKPAKKPVQAVHAARSYTDTAASGDR